MVGGSLRQDPGAQIRGQINNIGVGALDFSRFRELAAHSHATHLFFSSRLGNVIATLLRLVFLGMLASVVLFVARGPVERIARRSALEPLKAGVVGLLAQLLFFPLLVICIVILAVSIIGIPLLLLVPIVLVAALLIMVAGFAGVAQLVGRWGTTTFGKDPQQIYLVVWIGVALILAPTLLGRIMDAGGGFFRIFGVILALIGFLVEYAAWTTGIGAAVLNRFGSAGHPRLSAGPPPASQEPPPRQGPPPPPSVPDPSVPEHPPLAGTED